MQSAGPKNRWLRIGVGVFSILAVVAVAAFVSEDSASAPESLEIAARNGDKLFSWVNSFDDGKGVTSAGQHGGTQTISACDADDPDCLFHESSDADYSKSYWTGPGALIHHNLLVKVERASLRSSLK